MKRLLLLVLIGINLGLLACIVHRNTPYAHAQGWGGLNYIAVAARNGNVDTLYILETKTSRLIAMVPNAVGGTLMPTQKQAVPIIKAMDHHGNNE